LLAIVSAACFLATAFTDLGKQEPWFWVGSGFIAIAVSILLLWMSLKSPKDAKHNKSDESAATMEI
jgi:hypothetical protein